MKNLLTKSLRPCVACLLIASFWGCDAPNTTGNGSTVPVPTSSWMGISSAVNQVIVYLHEGTGWLLNKSEVSVKKVGDVRQQETAYVADYRITVHFGGETFETTAQQVPCDTDGIPTEASIERLRSAVEEIKSKMKRLQN